MSVSATLTNTDPLCFNICPFDAEVIVTSLKLVNAVAETAFVTVTIPADIADTFKFVPKLIVPAVPTRLPPSRTITPAPDPVTPVRPDPSPTNVPVVIPVN